MGNAQRPVMTNEHGIRNFHDAGRHICHRQKRTKRDLARVVHRFISEDTGPYLEAPPSQPIRTSLVYVLPFVNVATT